MAKGYKTYSVESMMDNLKMVDRDSIRGESSRELYGTERVVHPIHQILDVDSIVNTFTTDSRDVPPSSKDDIMVVGYPSEENIFAGPSFVGSFYPEYGVTNWVSECVTSDQMKGIYIIGNELKNTGVFPKFYEDATIDFKKIVKLADYKDSGYERGHLAAAGNHGYNSLAYRSTFWIGNTAPMHSGVNHILNKIEQQGRSLLKLGRDEKYKILYIITGSVFYPQDQEPERKIKFMKDDSEVQVPHAYFKVLVHRGILKDPNMLQVHAYMIENESDDDENIKRASQNISKARRRLDSINSATGLKILDRVNKKYLFDDKDPKPKEISYKKRFRAIGS